jgi:transposase
VRSPVDGSTTKKIIIYPETSLASLSIGARKDLTDGQWRILQPLRPKGKRPGRPPKWSRRQLLDGIRWRVRVGAPWRDVPERYGHWQSIYGLFRRWHLDGVWTRIRITLQGFADAAGLITRQVSVDSTINRAHQHAAGARHHPELQVEPPGLRTGRSRAGPLPRRPHDQAPSRL